MSVFYKTTQNVNTMDLYHICMIFTGLHELLFYLKIWIIIRLDSQIPFFCGDSPECLTLGSEAGLAQAMQNIESHFLMVGTLEELDKSYLVMECTMPGYMQGLQDMDRHTDLHKRDKHGHTIPLSREAREVMENRLENEYRLYTFVRERLEKQYQKCQS